MTKTEANIRRSSTIPAVTAVTAVTVFDGSLGELRKQLSAEAKRKEAESGYTYLTVRIPKENRSIRDILKKAVSDLVELSAQPEEIEPHIMAEARMYDKARAEIIKSGDWLTSSEVSRLAGFSNINPSAQPNKWKQQHRIFAIMYQNTDHYPVYALDRENGYRPLKALADVLNIFDGTMSGWGLAFWFSSMNSFLDDARPQDVLLKHPERVIAAARNEMLGVAHG